MSDKSRIPSTEDTQRNSAVVLGAIWAYWADICFELDQADWSRPTRCGDWNVGALTAHVASGVGGLRALLDERGVDGPAELTTAAEVMRAVKPSPEVAKSLARRVAASGRDQGAAWTPGDMVTMLREGVVVCARAGGCLDQSCDYFGRGIATIQAAVDLRIVEATVHLLDLGEALGRELKVAPGIDVTMAFLVDLVPPIDFIEAATGRRPVDFFPVHS